MDSKYYTPSIEDFYIGFEFEHRYRGTDSTYEVEGKKYTLETSDDYTPWQKHFDFSKFGDYDEDAIYDIEDSLKKGLIRVKYLDKKDIESLGWYDGDLISMSCYIFNHGKEDEFQLYHNEDNNFVQIFNWNTDGVFQGKIKNKSELIKVMKQLGING